MDSRVQSGGFVAALALLVTLPVQADEAVEALLDRTPENCISVNRIRSTKVIDDETILFYMRGGDIYQNILDRDCPRLEQNNRFMYETFGGRLCEIDTITVLEQFGGGLDRGFTCPLGGFYPITELEAEFLELGPDDVVRRGGNVEIEAVELPPEDDGERDE